ncbi:dTDP-4-dehydrorhamnose reductase [Pseudoteredinibacter isoporae]|uniref:dTDP-4-dehydrorhamnose reductase n=1 Tax=Pseudoteredinibacter isoporae TaxID=570281 RepID=A0A7X0JUD0_9GAMM|nr:dTDP-4-dehydrorhamnose reductase [Pseudoteredinibacter isoporae]MBB6521999.1 dTDP-4-dehydrorhamnose reductase [Pseudoteredinibacter isoporae]NHO87535.1 dTDP-4-dehydrorhamnose reductase [Pseudoteredinibacter isoporae]NIB24134.1 dTDP-4-dehydrorhamnose reductase [Pseudoteredinibacter isoporae]
MKILITGATGQLGYHLQEIASQENQGEEILCPGRDELNMADTESVDHYLCKHQPGYIINAAAYTAVDKSESEAELALAINRDAVEQMARYSIEQQCPLIQVSTDFVFSGEQGKPYAPDSKCQPLGVYGSSKHEGELAALKSPHARVVRTAWVYSEHGANFVKTMLRLARERDQLTVVADQIGSPTYARNLAAFIWKLRDSSSEQNIFHCCDAGVCSWYDFANGIFELAVDQGLLSQAPRVKPIRSEQYPTPAQRPHYSVLDCSASYEAVNAEPEHWRLALTQMLNTLGEQEKH